MSEGARELDGSRSAAAKIATGVHRLSFEEIPAAVVPVVERCFVDTVGVAIAGAETGAGELATEMVRTQSDGRGPASLLGGGRASVTAAGFANGTAAHCLDYDDTSDAIIGHTSACLVPAILAAADHAGGSGEAAVTAYVAGFETAASLAAAINPAHYRRGWHATGTFGTFGATAAAATMLELSAGEFAHAVNIAASMAAGLKRNFGTMTKPMHVGGAVRSGLTAALLAAEGFTAAADAIGGAGGFLDVYSGEAADSDRSIPPPGAGEAVLEFGIDLKKYPCCYFAQAAIDGVVELVREHDIEPTDVDAVTVTASAGAGDALAYPHPSTPFEGKFSMEYTVAHGLRHGDVGVAAFTDERLADPDIAALRDRVTFDVDADLPYASYETTIAVETTGETYANVVEYPPGSQANPLTDTELQAKFHRCTEATSGTADALFDQLSNLADQPDVTTILESSIP